MRLSLLAGILALAAAGCSTARVDQQTSLKPEQATSIAVKAANDKASEVYHYRPFVARHPAEFSKGRWVWSGIAAYGRGDVEATVYLAPDASTNQVELRLLDSRQILGRGF